MTVKMIAKMKFTYAGKDIASGDEFTASENDAIALGAFGRADKVDEIAVSESKKRHYRRRDMTAELS